MEWVPDFGISEKMHHFLRWRKQPFFWTKDCDFTGTRPFSENMVIHAYISFFHKTLLLHVPQQNEHFIFSTTFFDGL